MEKKLNDLVDKALSRRNFLVGAGTVAAGTVMAGCGSSTPVITSPTQSPTQTTSFTDKDYLNFALNLEYLEAEFYLHAATGSGLSTADAGTNAAAVTVPAKTQLSASVTLTSIQTSFVNELAQTELDHVRLLRAALGSYAIPRPAIDLTFFGPLAVAAGITTAPTFTPFDTYNDFLIGGFIFEDVGVTAYHGAALAITDKGILITGAQIHAVEAYHAGSLRTQIVAADAIAGNSTYTTIANKVSTLRGTLGGGNETALSSTSIVAASTGTSIGYFRTFDQVLHIVYGAAGGAGLTKGGFFPAGMNGLITATAA